jgi:tetratricopeptide (TPR) repeat protein
MRPSSVLLAVLLAAACAVALANAQPYSALALPAAARPRPGRKTPAAPNNAATTSLSRAERVKQFEAANAAGRRYLEADNAEEALKHFRQATELGPESSSAHANVGLCLMRLRRLEDALSAFERSEKYDEKQTIAVLKQAQILHELGRKAEADRVFRRVMALDPTDPWPFFQLAEYAAAAGKPREDPDTHGRYTQCAKLFQAKLALKGPPQLTPSQRGHYLEIMGKCLSKVGRSEEAYAAFDASFEVGHTFALISKADFLGQEDRMMEAAEAYEMVRPTPRDV